MLISGGVCLMQKQIFSQKVSLETCKSPVEEGVWHFEHVPKKWDDSAVYYILNLHSSCYPVGEFPKKKWEFHSCPRKGLLRISFENWRSRMNGPKKLSLTTSTPNFGWKLIQTPATNQTRKIPLFCLVTKNHVPSWQNKKSSRKIIFWKKTPFNTVVVQNFSERPFKNKCQKLHSRRSALGIGTMVLSFRSFRRILCLSYCT